MTNDRGAKLRNRKTKGLVALCAASLMVVGIGASAANAVVTLNLHPYIFGYIGVGATAPGDPDSELCIVRAAGVIDPEEDPGTYGGLINGEPDGDPGDLNIEYWNQAFLDNTAGTPEMQDSCVLTPVQIKTVDPVGTTGTQGINTTAVGKHGGTMQISFTNKIQPGIKALALTRIRVTAASGQIVKPPGGSYDPVPYDETADFVLATGFTGPGTKDFILKPVATVTKPKLLFSACADNQFVIDPTEMVSGKQTEDGPPYAIAGDSPRAWPVDSENDDAVTLLDALAGDGYLATIRECAQDESASLDSKASTTKISVTGAGETKVDFLESSTTNPQTWDNTRGKACSAAKYLLNTDPLLKTPDLTKSRALICKGDYGPVIPFSIGVRSEDPAHPEDPFGLLHPNGPVNMLTHTFP